MEEGCNTKTDRTQHQFPWKRIPSSCKYKFSPSFALRHEVTVFQTMAPTRLTFLVSSNLWTAADPSALETSKMPLKLLSSWNMTMISTTRIITATRSSKFSESTMHRMNHRVTWGVKTMTDASQNIHYYLLVHLVTSSFNYHTNTYSLFHTATKNPSSLTKVSNSSLLIYHALFTQ